MVMVVVVVDATGWTVLIVEESFEVAARVAARPVQDVLVLLCRAHAALAVVLVPPPFELFPRWQLARVTISSSPSPPTTHDTHGTRHKKGDATCEWMVASRPSGTSWAVPRRGAAARG